MVKRKAFAYICVVFLTFETILLLEQQRKLTNNNSFADTKNYKVSRDAFYQLNVTQNNGQNRTFNHSNIPSVYDDHYHTAGVTTGHTYSYNRYATGTINHQTKLNLIIRNAQLAIKHRQQYHVNKHIFLKMKRYNPAQIYKPMNALGVIKHAYNNRPNSPGNNIKFQQDERMQQRLTRITKQCQQKRIEGVVSRVLINPSKTVSYCVTHKVASTHWLRVFRYLWNDTKTGHVSSPSKISKFEAHYSQQRSVQELVFGAPEDRHVIMNTNRFMFVREPFNRLWSVYIDKFVLADNYFWSHHGPQMAALYGLPRLPPRKPCYNFTFSQFITYVIKSASDLNSMDDHIVPIHRVCNPCVFKPDFVGKVESMHTDNLPVLKVLNVTWADKVTSNTDRIYDELKTVIDFNFYLLSELKLLTPCLTPLSLGRRILKAFVLNGYIPVESEVALSEQLPVTKDDLLSKVWNVYENTKRTNKMIKVQRDRLRQQAYSDIPIEDMYTLQKIYRMDFSLFGYRLDPQDIFYNKTKS